MTYETIISDLDIAVIEVYAFITRFINFCTNTPLIMFALTITLVLPTIYFLIEWLLDLSRDYDLNFLGISKHIVSKFMKSKDDTEEAFKKARANYFKAQSKYFEAKAKNKK